MTPEFENQIQKLREQHPDTILLFRMGDFYEAFHEDARTIGKVLGLTLTSRDKSGNNATPMAGFPYHALEGYLAKLIAAGHRAAICDLVNENPKKPPVRKVSRVAAGKSTGRS